MRPAVGFLQALAHALATMTLYAPRHPASRAAADRAFQQLEGLFGDTPAPAYAFLEGGVVIYRSRPIHELQGWPWCERFHAAGVQRLEFTSTVTRASFGEFVDDLHQQLLVGGQGAVPPMRRGIRWGLVDVVTEEQLAAGPGGTGPFAYRLGEETNVVRGIFDSASESGVVDSQEAEMVVASLSVAMQESGQFLQLLLENADPGDYRTMHAINVSILAMSLGESLGMGAHDLHAVGVSALLHDVGLTQIPQALLERPVLTPEDRAIIERHVEIGARMLLHRDAAFDHASVVAYEHHMRPDGSGYPRSRFPWQMHYVSSIVAVADAYDALRTVRPWRPAWEPERAVAFIEQGAGTRFEAGVARAFATLLRRLELPQAQPA